MTRLSLTRRTRGHALIEALVACLVLAVALVGFTSCLIGALSAERQAAQRSHALRHAEAAAEHLRLLRGLDPVRRAPQLKNLHSRLQSDAQRHLPAGAQASLGEVQPDSQAYRIAFAWPTTGQARQEVLLWVR